MAQDFHPTYGPFSRELLWLAYYIPHYQYVKIGGEGSYTTHTARLSENPQEDHLKVCGPSSYKSSEGHTQKAVSLPVWIYITGVLNTSSTYPAPPSCNYIYALSSSESRLFIRSSGFTSSDFRQFPVFSGLFHSQKSKWLITGKLFRETILIARIFWREK